MEMDIDEYGGLAHLTLDPSSSSPYPLEIIHEDAHLLVAFKRHRQPVQSDKTGHPTLFNQICLSLKERYQTHEKIYLGLIHRLDRPAAGLIVFAKSKLGAANLSDQFRKRTIKKKYLALTENIPKNNSGRLSGYLSTPTVGPSLVHDEPLPNTKPAELEYRVLESHKNRCLVEVKLLTGRRHQIRAQMAQIGCSLLGDGKYGSSIPYLPGSIALVAEELGFNHPANNKDILIKLPPNLSSVRQWAP